MPVRDLRFRITESRNCPLYRTGDCFSVNGVALVPPKGKAGCVFLTKLITDMAMDILPGRRAAQAERSKNSPKILTCSGCAGFVRVTAISDEKYKTPLGKVLSRLEKDVPGVTDDNSLLSLLKNTSFFSALSAESLQEIVSSGVMKRFAVGAVILQAGSAGKDLYIVLSGRVAIENSEGVQLKILETGEIFGEMSILAGMPVSATVRALEPVRVLLLAAPELEQFLQRYPFLQAAFTRLLAHRLQETNQRCTEDSTNGISGQLSAVPISEVLQMIHENGRSGLVEMRLKNGEAAIRFHKGEIVDASCRAQRGIDAFFQILGEKEGAFRYVPNDEAAEAGSGEPIGGFMKILMEGIRRLDEENAARGNGPRQDEEGTPLLAAQA